MSRDAYLRRTYGISEAEYDALWINQGGRCAICKQLPPEGENLCVDHNHYSGANRGLLCQRCNKLLGLAGDSQELLLRGVFYLREHDGPEMQYPKFRGPNDSLESQQAGDAPPMNL
jgi:hypothetical protein